MELTVGLTGCMPLHGVPSASHHTASSDFDHGKVRRHESQEDLEMIIQQNGGRYGKVL